MREYDLLAGILAFQLRLVSAGTLAWYARTASDTPETRLLDFLADKGAMATEDWKLLHQITEQLVRAHQGDAAAALESFGGAAAAERAFAHTIQKTAAGWETSEDETVVASELPHGLPPQIVPESIGRYTRGSEYARGGIGRVLLVHDEQIGRDVILKELLPHRETSPNDPTLSRLPSPASPMRQSAAMVSRFLQEARITGQLEHPSIVPVYELGLRKDGKLYYTMKLVRGNTLAVTIAACRTLDDRLGLLRFYLDVCQAVAYAHSKGVIHRDLKPSNIMVGEFGECVVLDWGLARTQKDPDVHREAMEKTLSQLNLPAEHLEGLKTGSKEVLGTPLYMSPEQARGEIDTVGYHSDVYSLGVLLFEILSASLPHPWTNSHDTVRRVGMVPAPPVESVAPETPPELAAICNKALRFEPKDRYASARDLANDIERYLNGALVEAYAYRVSDVLRRLYRRHKPMIYTAALATFAIVATGAISYISIWNAREQEHEQRLAAESARSAAENARGLEAQARAAAEYNAYVAHLQLVQHNIARRDYVQARSNLWETPPALRGPEWSILLNSAYPEKYLVRVDDAFVLHAKLSPDGRSIATANFGGPSRIYDVQSGEERLRFHEENDRPEALSWNPVSPQLMIADQSGIIWIWNTATGALQHRLEAHRGIVSAASYSPDGTEILSAGNDGMARLWNVRTGALIHEFDSANSVAGAAYAPIGPFFAFTAAAGGISIYKRTEIGTPVNVPGHLFRFSPDGSTLVTVDEGGVIHLRDLAAGADRPGPPALEEGVFALDFSPDGSLLAVAGADRRVLIWHVERGELVQTLTEPGFTLETAFLDNALFATFGDGNRLRVVDLVNGTTAYSRMAHGMHGNTLSVLGNGMAVSTGGQNATFQVWDFQHPGTGDVYAFPRRGLTQPYTSPQGGLLALSGGSEGSYLMYRGSPARVLRFDARSLNKGIDLAAGMGDTRLLTAHDGFTAILWDLSGEAPRIQWMTPAGQGSVLALALSPNGEWAATAGWDGAIRIWDGATGEFRNEMPGHSDAVRDLAFSPDGLLLASASSDGTARIWRPATGQESGVLSGARGQLNCIAFAPDGSTVAAGGWDNNVYLWDSRDFRLLRGFSGADQMIMDVGFNGGNRLRAIAGGNTYFWDLAEGRPVAMAPMNVTSLPAGEFVVSEKETSSLQLFAPLVPAPAQSRHAFEVERREFTGTAIYRAKSVDCHVPVPEDRLHERLLAFAGALVAADTLAISGLPPGLCWNLSLIPEGHLHAVGGQAVSTPEMAVQHIEAGLESRAPGAIVTLGVIVDETPWQYTFHPVPLAALNSAVTVGQSEALRILDWFIGLLAVQASHYAYLDPGLRDEALELRPLASFPRDEMLRYGFSDLQRLTAFQGEPVRDRESIQRTLRDARDDVAANPGRGGSFTFSLSGGDFSTKQVQVTYRPAPV